MQNRFDAQGLNKFAASSNHLSKLALLMKPGCRFKWDLPSRLIYDVNIAWKLCQADRVGLAYMNCFA